MDFHALLKANLSALQEVDADLDFQLTRPGKPLG